MVCEILAVAKSKKMKKGFLWVLEEEKGRPTSRYVRKFFYAFPFCGLLFLEKEPNLRDVNLLIQKFPDFGWVIGGSIIPINAISRMPFEHEFSATGYFFPIILTVKSPDSTSEIFVAAENDESQRLWLTYFQELMTSLLFIKSHVDHDQLPIVQNFFLLNNNSDRISIENAGVSSRSLSALNFFFKSLHPFESVLRKLELRNCNLSDMHIPVINAFLHANSKLEEVVLSQNSFTSKGIRSLCLILCHCFRCSHLDLSLNYLDDSCSTYLAETVCKLPSLRKLNLSKNCFSLQSGKIFCTKLGNFNSTLEFVDFSFNEMGDEIGILVAFLLKIIPHKLVLADISFCGLTDKSVSQIAKSITACKSVNFIGLQGSVVSPEIARLLLREVANHHVLYASNNLICKLAGINFLTVNTTAISPKIFKSSFLELTDRTAVRELSFRKLYSSYPNLLCIRIGSTKLLNDVKKVIPLVLKVLPSVNCNPQALVHYPAFDGSSFLLCTYEDLAEPPENIFACINVSLQRIFEFQSIFMQWKNGLGGGIEVCRKYLVRSFDDDRHNFIPTFSTSDQYISTTLLGSEFNSDSWRTPIEFNFDETLAGEIQAAENESPEAFTNEFTNVFEYENNLREKRLKNERLIVAVRRLHQSKEVSTCVAKFWEGMLGNRKYKKFSEIELVKSMRSGHDVSCDESVDQSGLSHLFPAIARREQVLQAMYKRDIEEIGRLQDVLLPTHGGYALLYSSRLHGELVSLKQQFVNARLLATSFRDLPLIEDFLLHCGQFAYCGPEMFEAVEIRQRLFSLGVSNGGSSFAASLNSIKLKAIVTNLLISRDIEGLREKLTELRNLDEGSQVNEIQVAETALQDFEQCHYHLQSASEKKDFELLDLALAMSAYHNFYNTDVENCMKILNDVSRNPACLLRPVIEGLRNSNMSEVDRGFDTILKMGLRHEALDSVVCSKIHAIKARIMQVTMIIFRRCFA
jgi:hypothetical protein